jgi:hypothetical protein
MNSLTDGVSAKREAISNQKSKGRLKKLIVVFLYASGAAGKVNTKFFTGDKFRTSNEKANTTFFTSGECRMYFQ